MLRWFLVNNRILERMTRTIWNTTVLAVSDTLILLVFWFCEVYEGYLMSFLVCFSNVLSTCYFLGLRLFRIWRHSLANSLVILHVSLVWASFSDLILYALTCWIFFVVYRSAFAGTTDPLLLEDDGDDAVPLSAAKASQTKTSQTSTTNGRGADSGWNGPCCSKPMPAVLPP